MNRPVDEQAAAATSRRSYLTPLPNWVRAVDFLAELVVVAIVAGGFLTVGYAANSPARAWAFAGCALLGIWALAAVPLGRWNHSFMAPARWTVLLLAAAAAWTGLQLIRLPSALVLALSPAWRATADAAAAAGTSLPSFLPLAHSPAEALLSWHQLVASLLFFAGVCVLAARRSSSIRLMALVGAGCLLAGYMGIHRYIFSGEDRAWGAVYNPNHHATMMMMGMPLYFGGLAVWGRLSRRMQGSPFSGSNPLLFLYAAGLLGMVGWVASMSRGGLLIGGTFLLGWIVLEIWAYYREESGRLASGPLRMAAAAATTVVVLAIAGLLLLESASLPSGVSERGFTTADLREHGSGRLELWRATMQALGQSPATGLGLRGTEAALKQYSRMPTSKNPIWSHNDYVQALAEVGLLGGLLLAVLTAFLLASFLRESARRRAAFDWPERLLQRAATTGLLIVLVHETTDFHLRIPLIGFLFLILLALVLCPGALLATSMRRRSYTS